MVGKKKIDDVDEEEFEENEELEKLAKDPKAQKFVELFDYLFDKKTFAIKQAEQKKAEDEKRKDSGFRMPWD